MWGVYVNGANGREWGVGQAVIAVGAEQNCGGCVWSCGVVAPCDWKMHIYRREKWAGNLQLQLGVKVESASGGGYGAEESDAGVKMRCGCG